MIHGINPHEAEFSYTHPDEHDSTMRGYESVSRDLMAYEPLQDFRLEGVATLNTLKRQEVHPKLLNEMEEFIQRQDSAVRMFAKLIGSFYSKYETNMDAKNRFATRYWSVNKATLPHLMRVCYELKRNLRDATHKLITIKVPPEDTYNLDIFVTLWNKLHKTLRLDLDLEDVSDLLRSSSVKDFSWLGLEFTQLNGPMAQDTLDALAGKFIHHLEITPPYKASENKATVRAIPLFASIGDVVIKDLPVLEDVPKEWFVNGWLVLSNLPRLKKLPETIMAGLLSMSGLFIYNLTTDIQAIEGCHLTNMPHLERVDSINTYGTLHICECPHLGKAKQITVKGDLIVEAEQFSHANLEFVLNIDPALIGGAIMLNRHFQDEFLRQLDALKIAAVDDTEKDRYVKLRSKVMFMQETEDANV